MRYSIVARAVQGLVATTLVALCNCGPGFVSSEDAGTQGSGTTTTTGSDGSVPSTCGVDAYSNFGQAFFATNCGPACHSEKQDYAGVTSDLNSIISQIQSNAMPTGTPLSATNKARVLAWLNCGAPQNPTASGTSTTTTGGSATTTTSGSTSTTGGSTSTSTTTGGSSSTTTTGGSSCTADTYNNYAQAFFTKNCNSCHSFTTYAAVKE